MWKSNSFIINLILDLKCLLFIQCTVLQYQIYSKWPCDTFIWQLWSTLKIVILIFVLGLSLSQSSKLPWSSPFKQPGITDGGVPVKEFLPVFFVFILCAKIKTIFASFFKTNSVRKNQNHFCQFFKTNSVRKNQNQFCQFFKNYSVR